MKTRAGIVYYKPEFRERRRELRRAQPSAEKFLWEHIRDKKLDGHRFRRQYSVGPYILDFYCPSLRLAIELDGDQHSTPEGTEYDKERTNYLNSLDIKVLRFWNGDVLKNITEVVDKASKEAQRPST